MLKKMIRITVKADRGIELLSGRFMIIKQVGYMIEETMYLIKKIIHFLSDKSLKQI